MDWAFDYTLQAAGLPVTPDLHDTPLLTGLGNLALRAAAPDAQRAVGLSDIASAGGHRSGEGVAAAAGVLWDSIMHRLVVESTDDERIAVVQALCNIQCSNYGSLAVYLLNGVSMSAALGRIGIWLNLVELHALTYELKIMNFGLLVRTIVRKHRQVANW
ncbi:hypothetical protein B0T26DRAFT_757868 [Lasiosphaeria miniovina]|uniref:Uncharacterized protein n=1 Tax=Lasiosphaeria miniovina TaxID=1954250 RepID=A0AA39ZQN1_9PEZI|nr:uncharacterized protein B0T26DRAFT_757868 [Lasiosphaeria miniovina]KAK0701894.1 hypothetical protein B0T26DRAFT_757868 [Lasiosphaeria miniovina]